MTKQNGSISTEYGGSPLLSVRELCVSIGGRRIVDKVSFDVDRGSCLALVGESGSGKTMTALSLVGLLPRGGSAEGDVRLFSRDGEKRLLAMNGRELRLVRGREIATVFQNPSTSLTPTMRIGTAFREALRSQGMKSAKEARELSERSLFGVGIAADALRRYPYAFSGGQRQRIAIALATVLSPDLLIADEPTTALDVLSQKMITDIFKKERECGSSVLMISHNLALCHGLCDNVCVMYAGRVMERGGAELIFTRPLHPYTKALIRCIPDPGKSTPLWEIPPALRPWNGVGCPFAPRCPHAMEDCDREVEERMIDGRSVRCIAAEHLKDRQ